MTVNSGMYDLPGDSDYGLEFNYANWTPNTRIELLNVRWDNSYEDVCHFGSKAELNAWIDSQSGTSITFDDLTYARVNQPIDLDVPFNQAQKYNYMRVYNRAQSAYPGDTAKHFYYFINDVQFIAGNTTRFSVQLDVFQTFIYDVTFGNAFVERSHWGLRNDFDGYGRTWHNIPEGFDLGNELAIKKRYKHQITTANTNTVNDVDFSVMVTATVELQTAGAMASQNKIISATGSEIQYMPNGQSVSFFPTVEDFIDFMSAISNYPIISSGITGIYAVPDITDSGNYGSVTFTEQQITVGTTNTSVWYMGTKATSDRIQKTLKSNWRDDAINALPERYRHLKKFLTSPYCEIELTSNTGSPVVLHPENWNNADIEVMQVIHLAMPNPRIMFVPTGYNRSGVATESNGHGLTYDGGEFFDVSVGIDNLPTFSVVNNGFMSYMQQNKAGLAFNANSIDWSQQRATMGAQLKYNQATQSMATAQESFNTNMRAMGANHVTSMVSGMGNGLIGMAGSGSAQGMAGSAVNMAMNLGEQAVRYGTAVDQQNRLNDSSQYGMKYNRDTNLDFAQKAIAGDNAIARAGLSAKIQDAKTIQPSVSGQMGGESFMLANNYWGVEARVKMVSGAPMYTIGEHWLRYGYAVNEVVFHLPNNLKAMSNFTYWKCHEVYILNGGMPEPFKRVITGILKNGVTVWNDPVKIGSIDWADNTVIV